MKKELVTLIDRLAAEHKLSKEEYITLLTGCGAEEASYLAEKARTEKEKHYGNNVYIRGLIEISNICKNDCYYCGIRRSNQNEVDIRLEKIFRGIVNAKTVRACFFTLFRVYVVHGGNV